MPKKVVRSSSAKDVATGIPQRGGLEDLLNAIMPTEPAPTSKPKPSTAKPKPSTTAKPKPSTSKPKPVASSKPKPTASAPDSGAGGLDLGGLLQSLVGGGAAPSAPAAQSPLGGLLGGGGQTNPLLAPIVNMVAEKTGLPSAIAGVVVSLVLNNLLGGQSGGQKAAADSGLSLSSMLSGAAGRGSTVSPGLAQDIARQTGLDLDTSTRSMNMVLGMLGGQSPDAQ